MVHTTESGILQSKRRKVRGCRHNAYLHGLVLISLALSCAVQSGCWFEAPWYVRHGGDRIFFRSGTSALPDYRRELSTPRISLALRGFFHVTVTEQGRCHSLTLVVKCYDFDTGNDLQFDPDSGTATYMNGALTNRASEATEGDSTDRKVTFAIYLSDGTGKTVSVLSESPDFYEPHLTIDLSRLIKVAGVGVPIEPIVAYARDPSKR